MRPLLFAPLVAILLSVAVSAAAHSIQDIEEDLHARERYAQFVDRAAPGFTLTAPDDEVVSLTDLRDKVVVLNFIYSRCADVCPLHMNLIAKVQDMANAKGLRDSVEFITIATDTEDIAGTRENMRAYGKNFGFDPANWHFLYRAEGEPPETTKRIAEAYGLKFSDAGEGVQVHGVVTHVIDQTGELRARFHGLEFKPENLVSYVAVLAKGHQEPAGVFGKVSHYFKSFFDDRSTASD